MRALTPWRTHPQLNGLHDEIEDMFDRFFATDSARRDRVPGSALALTPALESFLRDDQIVIRADLPGMDPESVKASYQDGVLEITLSAPRGLVTRRVPISAH